MDGEGTPAQVGALLTALRMKGETVDEVVGAARAMRARMLKVAGEGRRCWTPAGPAGTARARSTSPPLASFIVAAGGVQVAKHGNRALSSRAGLATTSSRRWASTPRPSPQLAGRCLARGRAVLHVRARCTTRPPRRWPVPRREVGFRTLFNLLGPLTNPAGARFHLNGVFAAGALRVPGPGPPGARARSGRWWSTARAAWTRSRPTGATQVAELSADGSVRSYEITPADFGLPEADAAGLRGGEPADNARILRETAGRGARRGPAVGPDDRGGGALRGGGGRRPAQRRGAGGGGPGQRPGAGRCWTGSARWRRCHPARGPDRRR